MFETAEVGKKIPKEEFDEQLPALRTALLTVQNELRLKPVSSVVIVIGGVDGAGKGDTVNTLFEWMDPRFLEAHALGFPGPEEAERPEMWRFWRALPPRGSIGLYIGSWYTSPIINRVYKRLSRAGLARSIGRINAFERALTDDGTLLLKYWLHLSKKLQKRRLESLSKDSDMSWRVTPTDWKHFKLYDDFVDCSAHVLRETNTGDSPWTIVEGSDRRYRELTIANHILDSIKAHSKKVRRSAGPAKPPKLKRQHGSQPTILDTVDLTRSLEVKSYRRQLVKYQARLNQLQRQAQAQGVSMAAVFEGWDAAGKGGAVRRITRALDARNFRVVSIAAPTSEELARQYLWRFWLHLPRAGRLTIFDRSWYGRVLVERVEGFAKEEEWRRSYWEINEFEEQLTEHGTAVVKFWLHIDQDEQLRRFKAREQTSYKKYKITQEDYRNRAKWDLYEDAIDEMVQHTSTAHAPWTLVAANDKRFARVQVLKTCCASLAKALEVERERGKKGRK